MGEVYQATDTNLKRQVAIKVLPAALASDAERLARFQREAGSSSPLRPCERSWVQGVVATRVRFAELT